MSFKPQASAGALASKASAFFDRVKALPTTIYIDINGDTPVFTANIPFTMIYRVPVISELVLGIDGDPEVAFNTVNVFPNRHIDTLELVTFSMDPIHFGPFLSKFRTFRKLVTGYFKFGSLISPNLSYALSKLEEIDFSCVSEVPIVDLLALTPQLRILKMDRCHVRRNSEGGIDQCTLPIYSIFLPGAKGSHGAKFAPHLWWNLIPIVYQIFQTLMDSGTSYHIATPSHT